MIRIQLLKPSLSIKQLSSIDLPDFNVLIGRNGVGKTQLLRGIKNGNIAVSGIESDEIELFGLESFRPKNSARGGWGVSSFAAMTANQYLLGEHEPSPIESAKTIFNEITDQFGLIEGSEDRQIFEDKIRETIVGMQSLVSFPQVNGNAALEAYTSRINDQVMGRLPTTERSSGRQRDNITTKNDATSLINLTLKLNKKLPHEISRNDIIRAADFEGATIDNSISQVFAKYKLDQFLWAHTIGEESQLSFQSLMSQFRNENRPPWDLLSKTLARMREGTYDPEMFNFEFSNPESDRITFGNHMQYTFDTEMTNRATGDTYSVTQLSSGEQILMSLFLAAFNHQIGRNLPKLVLFDEVDSVLHPSMISAFIIGIKDLFVDNGTKVILATHSVTTTAMLEEGDIFRIERRNNRVSISSVTKFEAVTELSEGIATVDTGLKIAVSTVTPITILTEGKNALHLKKWSSLFFSDDVEVFDQLPDKTGSSQLETYGLLLSKMQTNSHFLIVWDCDAERNAQNLRSQISNSVNVTAFSFTKRPNCIVSKGIENKYDESILEPFSTRTTDSTGKEIARSFNSSKKSQFARHVITEGDENYFQYFDDLYTAVIQILDKLAN